MTLSLSLSSLGELKKEPERGIKREIRWLLWRVENKKFVYILGGTKGPQILIKYLFAIV